MATPRKSKAAAGKKKPAKPASRPKHAAPVKAAKGADRKPAPAAAGVRAGGKTPAAAARPVAKGKQPARRGAARPATPPPPVRPLGVLPPERRDRTSERHAPPPAPAAAPAVARRPAARPEPSGAEPLTSEDIKHFEARLHEELQKNRKDMGHLETTVLKVNPRDSSGDLSGYSYHMADAGTDAMEREKAFLFASVEGRKEGEIRAALRRIYDGTYGVCETCGQPIARARLEAVPYVRLCVSCKQKEEQQASRSQPG
ncbi:MAG TPA: TraR/DksA C4-type zinc finger protein [Candidatus Eisenbacteria bacterium]|jgi:RNA polymerase-binding transcription factor DksA